MNIDPLNFLTPVLKPSGIFETYWQRWLTRLRDSQATVLSGTYADRPSATLLPNGTTYYATDQGVTYVSVSGAWVYADGTMRGTLSPNTKPTLAVGDAGFLFYATDYQHLYRWSGTAWAYAPGDDGSGYFGFWSEAPTTGFWQLCDGTPAINRSTALGAVAAVTFSGLAAGVVPTWNSGQFVQMGAVVTGLAVAEANNLAVGNDNNDALIDFAVGALDVSLHTHQHSLTGTIVPKKGVVLAYLRL